MAEIGVFVVGFLLGGFAGMFVMSLAASASMADMRTRQNTDKDETDNPQDKNAQ